MSCKAKISIPLSIEGSSSEISRSPIASFSLSFGYGSFSLPEVSSGVECAHMADGLKEVACKRVDNSNENSDQGLDFLIPLRFGERRESETKGDSRANRALLKWFAQDEVQIRTR